MKMCCLGGKNSVVKGLKATQEPNGGGGGGGHWRGFPSSHTVWQENLAGNLIWQFGGL